MDAQASHLPGPGDYECKDARRGSRTPKWSTVNDPTWVGQLMNEKKKLPGPSDYHRTPTFEEQLSRQRHIIQNGLTPHPPEGAGAPRRRRRRPRRRRRGVAQA